MRKKVSPAFVLIRSMALVSLVTALWTPAVSASQVEPPYRVLAGPYVKKEVKEGVGHPSARITLKGLMIAVEFMEPAPRAAFVKSIDATMRDPFMGRPGLPEPFTTFRVTFENRAKFDIQFQPGNVVRFSDRKTQDFPVDLTDLYRVAEQVEVSDPERMIDRIAPLMFDSSTTIRKDNTVDRLLVFPPFPEKWKEIKLYFSFLQIGTETQSLSFHFHKQPLKG